MMMARQGMVFQGTLLLLAALSLGGCVTTYPPEVRPETAGDVTKVLTNAYEEITENYVDPVAVPDLATAGLSHMSTLEPGLALDEGPERVTLVLKGEAIHSFAKPSPKDLDAWAEAVAGALIAARENAPGLRTVSDARFFEAYLGGIAGALERGGHYISDEKFRSVLFSQYDSTIAFSYRVRPTGLEVWRFDPGGNLEGEGLKKGDIVTHIDATSVLGLSKLEAGLRLAGPEGSKVTLTVLRGEPPSSIDLEVTRWKYELPTYEFSRRGRIAVFQLPYLNPRATRDLSYRLGVELNADKAGGRPPAGLILDLRGNLGGSELYFTDLANAFLGKGNISTQRGYPAAQKRVINASWPDRSHNLPLVVLVDGITGYGVEDVVAALQDNQRAVVIGSSTVGDGIVKHNVSLYNMGVIQMPVAFSYAPSGYAIAGRGVMPQVCTSTPGATLEGLLAALHRGEGLIDEATRQRQIDPDDVGAIEAYRALCPPEPDEDDLALDLALAILADANLYARLSGDGAGL